MKQGAVLATIAVIAVVAIVAVLFATGTFSTTDKNVPPPAAVGNNGEVVAQGCAQNPAYTYSAKDAYATTVVTGTDQIKDGDLAPVSSLANPPVGDALKYWKSNTTYFCEVKDAGVVKCGAQQVQAKCYLNATSSTVSVYDKVGRVTLTNGGGANNITVGANGLANLEVDLTGVAKQSSYPFGGCVVVEVPSTITSATMSGAGVGGACPYPITYTVSSTSNTYKAFALADGFDKDGAGDTKAINLQLQAGSSNPSGKAYVTFYPANTYVTNDGNFVTGIEKDKNQDTTKAFANGGITTSFQID